MTEQVYFDNWTKWADVSNDFSNGYSWNMPAVPAIPEPEEVLLAAYSYEDYSGDAFVIYRQGDKYYTNEGGHCSCHGLEGQWSPEAYTLPVLITALEKFKYGIFEQHKDRILKLLRAR